MECKTCGKEFEPITGNQVYCNVKCRPLVGQQYTLKCVICKKEFKNGCKKVMTCSKKCLDQLRLNRKNKKYNQKSIYNLDKDIRIVVRPIIEDILNKSMAQGENMNGQAIDFRHIVFNETARNKILDRDKFKCRICNAEVNLHIHHIIPRQFGGSHEENNLITLCAKCHMHIETGDVEHAVNKCSNNYKAIMNNRITLKKSSELTNKEIIRSQNEFIKSIFNKINGTNNKSLEIKEVLCSIDNFLGNLIID